jgi:hypothetical protein
MSVLRDFNHFLKYNLQQIVAPLKAPEASDAAAAPDVSVEEPAKADE